KVADASRTFKDRTSVRLRRARLLPPLVVAMIVVSSGGAFAAGFTGQGIYPGDPDANAIKLPGEFEAAIRPRMFYKNTDTLSGGEQEAWVIGGLAGLRSPWLAELFQFGAVGYISQKLSGP